MALTYSTTANYRGELYAIADTETPFLARTLANGSKNGSFVFVDNVGSSVTAGTQDTQTEAATIAGTAAVTYTKGQTTNTCQIQMEASEVSFRKLSDQQNVVSGINNSQMMSQPDGLTFQKSMALKKMANDYEYSLLQGTYQAASDTATAAQTRGLAASITTNATAAGSIELSSALIDSLMLDMFDNGAKLNGNLVAVCSAADKARLDGIYGTQPESRTEGGVNLTTYYTALGSFSVIYTVNAPANTFMMLNMDYIFPRWNIPDVSQVADIMGAKGIQIGNGVEMYDQNDQGMAFNGLMWIPKLGTAASAGGWLYSHFGGEYGPESYHGKITGLTA